MTRDEAISVTEMILNSWISPHWTDAQTETYVNSLVPYDAEYAVAAIAVAHRTVGFRPSFADLLKFYHHVKSESEKRMREEQRGKHPLPAAVYSKKMPPWVKEWCCARFLHARFGRDQDMRRFAQQGEWRHPDEALMPPGEWAKEATHITDRDAWAAIRL